MVENKMTLGDSELDDLIGGSKATATTVTTTTETTTAAAAAPIPSTAVKYPSYFRPTAPQSLQQPSSNASSPESPNVATLSQIPTLIMYMIMSFLLQCPRCAKLLTSILLLSVVYILFNVSTRGTSERIGFVKYDFSKVHSKFDFEIGKIDHWCIDYSDDCQCDDPLQPTPRLTNTNRRRYKYFDEMNVDISFPSSSKEMNNQNKRLGQRNNAKEWYKAHLNYTKIGTTVNPTHRHNIDVAFLGQSVVEAFDGKHNMWDMIQWESEQGHSVKRKRNANGNGSGGDYFGHVNHMFQKRFQSPSDMNHDLYGVAMGIAGDQAGNVLWRLLNGELSKDFNPSVWWIVIGMEEVARYKCSEEIVIMGILRIVEEIKNVKPDAKIVINGLFPMVAMRSDAPEPEDFLDAERSETDTDSDDEVKVEVEDRPHRSSRGHNDNHNKGRNRNHSGGHSIRRNLASRHRNRRHRNRHDGSEDESEDSEPKGDGDGGEIFDSERKHAKRFRKDKHKKVREHFNNMVDEHRAEEHHLKDLIHDLKHDHHSKLSRSEKHQRLDEMSAALEKMKRSHAKHEESMKSYIKDVARDSYNPVMKEKHRFRKDNFFHHHGGDSRHLPVWTAIHEINRQLKEFCKNTDKIAFYDPTHLFTSKTEEGKFKLLTDFISPRGHPTQMGMKLWLNEIQKKVIDWKITDENEAKGDYSNIVASSEDDWEASSYIINHHYYGEKMEGIEGMEDMDLTDAEEDGPEVEGEEDEGEGEEESEDEGEDKSEDEESSLEEKEGQEPEQETSPNVDQDSELDGTETEDAENQD